MTTEFFSQDSSVGGHSVHIASSEHGFEYIPGDSAIFSQTPGNHAFFRLQYMVGSEATPGAFGCFIPGVRTHALFRHQKPWSQLCVAADTEAEFITEAKRRHQQDMIAGPRIHLPDGL
ncbi:hypothetical protein A2J03_09520 [Rhodococcus sp. EPR-157]|nr:hypothetical protein A2J03_09520 [Rhodococcus sp. EPR-157]